MTNIRDMITKIGFNNIPLRVKFPGKRGHARLSLGFLFRKGFLFI
jgi:hypothetical protein